MLINFSKNEIFFMGEAIKSALDTAERLYWKGEAEIWAAEEGISLKEAEQSMANEINAYRRILKKIERR